MKRWIIAVVILLVVVAFGLPRLLPTRANEYDGELRAMAVYSIKQVETFGLEGLQGLPVLGLAVESVDSIAGSAPCEYVLGGNETKLRLSRDYRAVIRLRTVLGLGYARIAVTCRTLTWL